MGHVYSPHGWMQQVSWHRLVVPKDLHVWEPAMLERYVYILGP